jgi:hypothetical protein
MEKNGAQISLGKKRCFQVSRSLLHKKNQTFKAADTNKSIASGHKVCMMVTITVICMIRNSFVKIHIYLRRQACCLNLAQCCVLRELNLGKTFQRHHLKNLKILFIASFLKRTTTGKR